MSIGISKKELEKWYKEYQETFYPHFNEGVEHCIEALKNMKSDPVNDDSASFYWGIDKDEAISKLEQLKKPLQ